jgi:Protein of unknown function with HXXEE motif
MNLGNSDQRFGICWLFFGYTLALHVLDEAGHDFLSVYIPNALAIRRAVPFLPIPVFTFQSWIGSLALALTLLLAMTPLAFRGLKWVRGLAIPIAALVGIGNGLAHILSSLYMKRLMPGVYSAPLLLVSGTLLIRTALAKNQESDAVLKS